MNLKHPIWTILLPALLVTIGPFYHLGLIIHDFVMQMSTLDTRTNGSSLVKQDRPTVESGQLWTDPEFGFAEAMEGLDHKATWKRPWVSG